MGQAGRTEREEASHALQPSARAGADIVDLAARRRRRDAIRHFPPKIYTEHLLIGAIVVAAYAVAAAALL